MISFKMMISWFPAQDKEFSIAVLMARGNVLQLLHKVDFFELHNLCSILHLKMAHMGVDQPRTEECSRSSTGSPFHSCPACLFQNHHQLLSCFSYSRHMWCNHEATEGRCELHWMTALGKRTSDALSPDYKQIKTSLVKHLNAFPCWNHITSDLSNLVLTEWNMLFFDLIWFDLIY